MTVIPLISGSHCIYLEEGFKFTKGFKSSWFAVNDYTNWVTTSLKYRKLRISSSARHCQGLYYYYKLKLLPPFNRTW